MARPPVEWPIPAYVTELRERLILSCRVPAASLRAHVPVPLTPETRRGEAIVSVALGNVRCLKAVGGPAILASEFQIAEWTTPVRWNGACREPLRGSYLLGFSSNRRGIARMLQLSLGFAADHADQGFATARQDMTFELRGAQGPLAAVLARPVTEAAWPGCSLYAGAEEAETAQFHPGHYFVPETGRAAVNAVPVHHYARVTVPVAVAGVSLQPFGRLLGIDEREIRLDHAFFQKRCTHTWSFPPERIITAGAIRAASPARERLALAGRH